MEAFYVLLVVAFLLLPFLGLAGFVLAVGNRRDLRERVGRLEAQIGALRAALREVREGRPDIGGEPTEEATPRADRPERPAPEPSPLPPPEKEPQPPPRAHEAAPPEPPGSQAPPTPPSVDSVPPKKPAPAKPEADWERWLGVRGAALLGGIVLALAGLLFFQYSIEKGWISPLVRVVFGNAAGIGLLFASETLRRREYVSVANALAGGAVVVLYAASWAAGIHYGLIPVAVAWGLMILVTVVACLLAVKRNTMVVAVLGLVGGFATPLLLGQGHDRPLGLFGYLLLLDVGLLAVAHRRRWPSLALLALLGTFGLEGLWALRHFDGARVLLSVAVLGAFVVLFLAASVRLHGDELGSRLATQAGAVLLPFAFAIYFAGRVDLGESLMPITGLLLILCAAGGWVARRRGAPWLSVGAAVGSVAVLGVWLAGASPSQGNAWLATGSVLALAAVFHLFVELPPAPEDDPRLPSVVAFLGFSFLLFFAAEWRVGIWPWVAGWSGLSAGWVRQALRGRGPRSLVIAGSLLLVLGPGSLHLRHGADDTFPEAWVFLGLVVAIGVTGLGIALRLEPPLRRLLGRGTALYAMGALVLLGLGPLWRASGVGGIGLAAFGLLLILGLAGAALDGRGGWLVAFAAASLFCPYAWSSEGFPGTTLWAGALALAAVSLSPFAFASLRRKRWTWYGVAGVGPLLAPALIDSWQRVWGDAALGLLPVLLASTTVASLAGARRCLLSEDPARRSAVVWLSAVALGFVSLAVPLQLEREWITVAWALEGLAVILLWRRLDHPGLKYFGLALAGAVGCRLLLNPAVLTYGDAGGWPVLNWLAYTYLLPAICVGAMAAGLRSSEVDRLRGWELRFYGGGRPVVTSILGLLAVVLGFAWVNLAVLEAFAEGTSLRISLDRQPARDLTLSLAWVAYALALLVAGTWKSRTSLRWVSLGFLLLAIAKVFLYDLGELEDLYRVLSLLGLAASLILVSLLYQRFVFRDRRAAGP